MLQQSLFGRTKNRKESRFKQFNWVKKKFVIDRRIYLAVKDTDLVLLFRNSCMQMWAVIISYVNKTTWSVLLASVQSVSLLSLFSPPITRSNNRISNSIDIYFYFVIGWRQWWCLLKRLEMRNVNIKRQSDFSDSEFSIFIGHHLSDYRNNVSLTSLFGLLD